MQSWFSASFLQSSVSHDLSEISLIYWYAAQETFLIIISCAASYFYGNCDTGFFQDSLTKTQNNNLFEIESFWFIL